jgi:2-methylisocitrate lyase-like PEP mutase family enzyme
MLEGGGKTPILNAQELDQVGYKLAVYPLSLMAVSIRAMQVKFTCLSMPLPFNNSIRDAKR